MSSSLLTWAIVIAYLAFIFIKGVAKAKKVQHLDDFLVAGRNIGWFFLFCTMGATVIGGGASVGAIGKTYEWGILMLLVSSGWYLHFVFSGLLVAPVFRRARLYTVAGYFGLRFGEGPRFVVMLLSLLFSVFIIAAQMAAFGSVLSALMPEFAASRTVLTTCILVGGLMVVVYSTAGGLLAVIHTDVYQFVILLAGLLVTLASCAPDLIASWDQVQQQLPESFLALEGGKGWGFLVTTFLAFLLGETFAPGYATRYCVGKNVRETRIGIAGVGVFLAIVFPAILFFIALYARLHYPDIEPQQALPMVISRLNTPLVAGMMVGALLMAVMSSADSALNSATAVFVKDLFEHQLRWRADEARMLRRARFCSAALGGVAIAVAVAWPDIIGLLLFTYHLWAPAIIVPVCVGIFGRRRGPSETRNILVTMLVAVAATLAYRFSSYREQIDPSVFGVAVSLVTYATLRVFTRGDPADLCPSSPR
ncbi:MAG: sodium:solute symporter family protein [Deltaproteobacteria bacterium]|nr:sodium:solute symporter family protein [Deltaproteobacteria bacterium]